MIWHLVQKYVSKNESENARNRRAEANWSQLYSDRFRSCHIHERDMNDTALTIGDTRALPRLKTLVNRACQNALASDAICLTNTDSQLCREAVATMLQALDLGDAWWSHRRTFYRELKHLMTHDRIMGQGEENNGVDLVVFRVSWWRIHEHEYPDVFLGVEGWDWLFRFTCKQLPTLVAHEYHQTPTWYKSMSPARYWNRVACLKWVEKQEPEKQARIRRDWPALAKYAEDPKMEFPDSKGGSK